MSNSTTGRPGMTAAELGARYGRSAATIRTWLAEPEAPAPVGKRGKAHEYDPDQAEAHFRRTHLPPLPDPDDDPGRLLTLAEAADRAGIEYSTASSYVARGQWPDPDEVRDGVKLWKAATIDQRRANRKRLR